MVSTRYALRRFLRAETGSGAVLLVAAVSALIWVNVLIAGLVNGMVLLVHGPLIDKLLKKPFVEKTLARFGITGLV